MLLADDEDELNATENTPPGTRDPRSMSAAAFRLARFLTPEERAALAARPRFYRMPWLRLLTHDETPRDSRDDDLPP